MSKATPSDVAEWMLAELERDSGVLSQEDAVGQIEMKFGAEFAPVNDSGNSSIRSDVLKAFRRISPDVIWERGERQWRKRAPFDAPGRQQD